MNSTPTTISLHDLRRRAGVQPILVLDLQIHRICHIDEVLAQSSPNDHSNSPIVVLVKFWPVPVLVLHIVENTYRIWSRLQPILGVSRKVERLQPFASILIIIPSSVTPGLMGLQQPE